MKKLPSIVAPGLCAALVACGGGGSSAPTSVLPPKTQSTATGETTLTITVPGKIISSTSSVVRTPQYLSPAVTALWVDLQNNANPAYDYTISFDSSACESVSIEDTSRVCTYTLSFPLGNQTLSIAAVDATAILSYGTATINITPGGNSTVTTTLEAIAVSVDISYTFGVLGPLNTAPSEDEAYPYVEPAIYDASSTNQPIAFPSPEYGPQLPTILANPIAFAVSSDVGAGGETLSELIPEGPGSHIPDIVNGTPAASLSIVGWFGDGFEVNNPYSATWNIIANVPAFTLHDTEFPQIDSFPSHPKSWTAGGVENFDTVQCGIKPVVAYGQPLVDPCKYIFKGT